jgi:hypothetical protein
MPHFKAGVSLFGVVLLLGLWSAPPAGAAEKPRHGGILRVALAGDPPSLDMQTMG